MKTLLANADLQDHVFERLAAALQNDDPDLSIMPGMVGGHDNRQIQLAVLLKLRTQSNLARLMTTRNHVEALGAECRRLGLWRNLQSVTFVMCCSSPIQGHDAGATGVLIDAASQTFPKRAGIHLAMLEYSFGPQSRRVQNYSIHGCDDLSIAAQLLSDVMTTAMDAGVSTLARET